MRKIGSYLRRFLLPILGIVALLVILVLGIISRVTGLLKVQDIAPLNKLIFMFCIPCLAFKIMGLSRRCSKHHHHHTASTVNNCLDPDKQRLTGCRRWTGGLCCCSSRSVPLLR